MFKITYSLFIITKFAVIRLKMLFFKWIGKSTIMQFFIFCTKPWNNQTYSGADLKFKPISWLLYCSRFYTDIWRYHSLLFFSFTHRAGDLCYLRFLHALKTSVLFCNNMVKNSIPKTLWHGNSRFAVSVSACETLQFSASQTEGLARSAGTPLNLCFYSAAPSKAAEPANWSHMNSAAICFSWIWLIEMAQIHKQPHVTAIQTKQRATTKNKSLST